MTPKQYETRWILITYWDAGIDIEMKMTYTRASNGIHFA